MLWLLHFRLIDLSICKHLWSCGVMVLRKGIPGALCDCMQEMLQEFSRELQALKQREERIVKLCLKQQATLKYEESGNSLRLWCISSNSALR